MPCKCDSRLGPESQPAVFPAFIRSYFAATIPIAALVAATALMPHAKGLSAGLWWAGGVTLGIASAIVLALGVRTVRGFVTGELLQPED